MRNARFPTDADPDPSSLARAATMTGTSPWTTTTTGVSAWAGAPPEAATMTGTPPKAAAPPGAATRSGVSAWAAPSRAALRTADAMGLAPVSTPALAEADHGRWRGLTYERVARQEPDALASWLADPHAAPHGGESLVALAARVASWLEATRSEPSGVAVCDAGAIRAALGHALGLDPVATARFDLAPLSTTELTVTRSGWRVAHVNRKAPL